MMTFLRDRLVWRPNPVGGAERLRAAAGAFCGLLLTGLLTGLTSWPGHNTAFLIAPMGASSVLLFAVPASPLAQPWSVIGGNILSGLIGVACVQLLGASLPLVALAPLAACLAIAAMLSLRCLHPPSGAVALTMVLGGPAVHAAGFGFVLAPVALNSVLMVAAAIAYNRLTGRAYPHRQQVVQPNPHATKDPVPTRRLGFNADDLDNVLRRYQDVLDIGRLDLEAIIEQTELQAYQRRFGVVRCADIMSRDVVTTRFDTPLAQAWALLREHRVTALPVLNKAGGVIGVLALADLPGRIETVQAGEVVGEIMNGQPVTVPAHTAIVDLVPLMADRAVHQVLVVDGDGNLAGIVTESDLVAALYEGRLGEMAKEKYIIT